jgi:hypothetical protein
MSEPYKGLTVPLYTDAADGPAAFKALVDSGPIPRFATAATRDAAITAPVSGQVCFRSDLAGGALEMYAGGAWVPVAPSSTLAHSHAATDITGVLTAAQIPNLDATKITTGILAAARLPAGTTAVAGALRLASTLGTSDALAATQGLVDDVDTKADQKYGASSQAIAGRKIWIQSATPAMSNGDVWFKI